jgi:protein-tyrosine kinase
MSSLIEQAAERLEQLRRAGVEVPGSPAAPAPVVARAPVVEPQPIPQSRKVDLNLETLNQRGIATPHGPRTPTADQFRVIKRPLITNAMGKGATPMKRGNLIMVTSALPVRARASPRSTWR